MGKLTHYRTAFKRNAFSAIGRLGGAKSSYLHVFIFQDIIPRMAEWFDINLTSGAEADLIWFPAYAQRIIVDGMEFTCGISRQREAVRSSPCSRIQLPAGNYV